MTNSLATFTLLSAITMALTYRPILKKLSFSLAVAYAKADIRKRLFAATVDVLLVASALASYRTSGSLAYPFAGLAYLLFRDAILGRSLGKFIFGLVVVRLKTGGPAGVGASIGRNILFVIPGANVVAAFFEAETAIRDPQGQRLGDRFTLTQVVEGFGIKDLIAEIQEALLDFDAHLVNHPGRPERDPIRLPR